MSRFKPGDKVVVVKEMPWDYSSNRIPVGTVCTIREGNTMGTSKPMVLPESTWIEGKYCHYPVEYFEHQNTDLADLHAAVAKLRRDGYVVECKVTEKVVTEKEIVV